MRDPVGVDESNERAELVVVVVTPSPKRVGVTGDEPERVAHVPVHASLGVGHGGGALCLVVSQPRVIDPTRLGA